MKFKEFKKVLFDAADTWAEGIIQCKITECEVTKSNPGIIPLNKVTHDYGPGTVWMLIMKGLLSSSDSSKWAFMEFSNGTILMKCNPSYKELTNGSISGNCSVELDSIKLDRLAEMFKKYGESLKHINKYKSAIVECIEGRGDRKIKKAIIKYLERQTRK